MTEDQLSPKGGYGPPYDSLALRAKAVSPWRWFELAPPPPGPPWATLWETGRRYKAQWGTLSDDPTESGGLDSVHAALAAGREVPMTALAQACAAIFVGGPIVDYWVERGSVAQAVEFFLATENGPVLHADGPRPARFRLHHSSTQRGILRPNRSKIPHDIRPVDFVRPLRRHLVSCPGPSFADALAIARTHYPQASARMRFWLAYLFPEETSWVEEAVARDPCPVNFPDRLAGMVRNLSRLPAEVVVLTMAGKPLTRPVHYPPTDLLMIHGPRALPRVGHDAVLLEIPCPQVAEHLTRQVSQPARPGTSGRLYWGMGVAHAFAQRHPRLGVGAFAAKAALGDLAALSILPVLCRDQPEGAREALADLDGRAHTLVSTLLDPGSTPDEATPKPLPSVLANPPWRGAKKASRKRGSDGPSKVASVLMSFPRKRPPLPYFYAPDLLPQPRLKNGAVLGNDATIALAEMLAFQHPKEPTYIGLIQAIKACDVASLGAFASTLFELWLGTGASPDWGWMFRCSGLLGDDGVVNLLEPYLHRWPEASLLKRATTGMDVLVGIGSHLAMTALVRLHQHPRKSVRKAARARLSTLAAARGLTEEALEDSLVPHLGLDAQGTLAFDFGARIFHLGLDPHLKPHARDAAGKRFAKLPKAGPDDDPTLSAQAHLQWKVLCKALKGVSKAHLPRLERAMVNGRRWSRADFSQHLGEHPVLRHPVRALVWAGWADEEVHPSVTFRVTLAGEFVDPEGGVIEVPDGVMIGIVHPVDLDSTQSRSWATAFSCLDFEQPFAQLKRVVRRREDGPTPADLVGTHGAVGHWRGLSTSGWGISDVPGTFDGYAAGLVYGEARGGCLEITLEEGYQLGRGQPAHARYTVARCQESPPLSARAYSEAMCSLHFLADET